MSYNSEKMNIQHSEGLTFVKNIDKLSVDLVLTDPPYITSRKTGMDVHYKLVNELKDSGNSAKTEEEWNNYKTEEEWNEWFIENNIKNTPAKMKEFKKNYISYGSIYGKKYAVNTDYGEWDTNFTMDILEEFVKEYFRVLKNGGTLIIFFDLWKISYLKDIMESVGFKQIRFIEWIKTNPQPLNSKVNYLTNCREIALIGIKKTKPTFNSSYDNGIYHFPLQGGKNRCHPTQKSLKLFEELITKHSNQNDVVLDTFLGSGTTALACIKTNRQFIGCEVSEEYFKKSIEIIGKMIEPEFIIESDNE